jgi:hypothetical protein
MRPDFATLITISSTAAFDGAQTNTCCDDVFVSVFLIKKKGERYHQKEYFRLWRAKHSKVPRL